MNAGKAIPCIVCRRPVDPKRGGAWCDEHTPLDLTGGVAPHDLVASSRPTWTPDRRGRAGRPRRGDERAAEWAELYRSGASTYTIATASGAKPAFVAAVLRRAGVELRSVGRGAA